MKASTSQFIVFLITLHYTVSSARIKSDSLVPYAIARILTEHFAKTPWKVDLIQYGNKSEISEKCIDKILRIQNGSTVLRITTGWKINLKTSTILLFDSVKSFKNIIPNVRWITTFLGSIRHPHLVYVPNITQSDIAEVIGVENGPYNVDQVGFLINETEKSIDLATFFMFTQSACRSNQLVTINRFNLSSGWENSTFYPDKYENFHGCVLTVAARLKILESSGMYRDSSLLTIEALGRKRNFSCRFVEILNETQRKEADMLAAHQEADIDHLLSQPYEFHQFVIFIPPDNPYTPFEKMFMPFQVDFWIAIAATLSIACAVIQVVNFTSIKTQNFIYGRGIRTPMVNLADIFLNGGQYKVPKRNFARFFLVLFIIWSLIVRTCYQSELFKYLQGDLRKPVPETIDELFRLNFSMFNNSFVEHYFGYSLKHKYPNATLVHVEGSENLLEIVSEPANKITSFAPDFLMYYIHNKAYRAGTPSVQILNERVKPVYLGLSIERFNPFYEILSDQVLRMIAGGILQLPWDRLRYVRGGIRKAEDIEPQVLTMEHLGIGFMFWLVPLTIGLLALLGEIMIHRIKKLCCKVLQKKPAQLQKQIVHGRRNQDPTRCNKDRTRPKRHHQQARNSASVQQPSKAVPTLKQLATQNIRQQLATQILQQPLLQLENYKRSTKAKKLTVAVPKLI